MGPTRRARRFVTTTPRRAIEYAPSVLDGDEFVLVHVADSSESITDPGRGGRGRLEGW